MTDDAVYSDEITFDENTLELMRYS